MIKSKKLSIYLLAVLVVLIILYLGYAYGKESFPFSAKKWQAVQLISGDIYYGELETFPCCELKNVFFVQNIEQGTTTNPQLFPLSSLFFAPENNIHLEKSQILWWADLSEESQVLQAFKEQK